jgi:lipid-A-disaccharide synthase-like uncharacterized protein
MKPSSRKRFKWEPAAAMVMVLALGLWLALGPASGPRFDIHKDATTQEVRIGNTRGVLESVQQAGTMRVRLHMQGQARAREFTAAELEETFGERVYAQAVHPRLNWIFRTLNITSWANLVWIGIGFGGQLAFSGRMLLQWIVSEKRGESVISESFWWFSLFGAVMLFSYFVWRQDPVGILGQATGVVIYARNLRLIHKQKRRAARAAPDEPDRP